MSPANPLALSVMIPDRDSAVAHTLFDQNWIQPAVTMLDIGGSPLGLVDELYARYEPEETPDADDWAASLDQMANDTQIQGEIQSLEALFAPTLLDGLEGDE